jgi:hypothetical protein
VKGTAFLAAAFLAAGASAFAQDRGTASQGVPQTVSQPAPPAIVQPPASQDSPTRVPQIRMFADVLSAAVKSGAKIVANQMRIAEPGSLFATSDARTRGIELEGYGVFFDVDVPNMLQSVAWSMQMLQREQYIQQLRGQLATLPEGSLKDFARNELTRLQRPLGSDMGASAAQPYTVASSDKPMQPAKPGEVGAATIDIPAVSNPLAETARVATPAADPNVLYTNSVKDALIDAMLYNSAALRLGDDEWLTVAARGDEGPPIPGQLHDASSIVIRIKGSDLSAFLAKRISREEVLKRVQVREF